MAALMYDQVNQLRDKVLEHGDSKSRVMVLCERTTPEDLIEVRLAHLLV